MLTLFSDETIVAQPTKYVTLTTHRIWNEKSSFSKTVQQSIMLEHITSCESRRTSYILLLLLAIALGAGAINMSTTHADEATAPLALAGVLFVVLYFSIKRTKMIISSHSIKMHISLTGLKRDKVHDFVNTIEQTKQKRLDSLRHPGTIG